MWVLLRCPVACRATAVITERLGVTAVARRSGVALDAGITTTVAIPLTAAGRRRLPSPLTATITLRSANGSATTITRRARLGATPRRGRLGVTAPVS